VDTGGPSPGVMRQDREGDHSPTSSAEVKNGGAISPLHHTSSWFGAELIKHRDKFYFFHTEILKARDQLVDMAVDVLTLNET
jgi:hypothetical protein